MITGHNSDVANDNAPAGKAPLQQRHQGFFEKSARNESDTINLEVSSLKPGQLSWAPGEKPGTTDYSKFLPKDINPKESDPLSIIRFWLEALLLTGFLGSFAGLIASFNVDGKVESQTLFTMAVVAFGVCSLTIVKLPRLLREWAAISLFAVPLIFAFGVLQFPVESLAIPAIILGMVIGLLGRAWAPLFLAGLSLLGFAYIASPLHTMPLKVSSIKGSVLTGAVFILLGVATSQKMKFIMAIALASFFAWGSIWLLNSGLSQRAIAAFVFIIGAAQYKLGKAGLDEKSFAAFTSLISGWFLSVGAFIWLQSGYLDNQASSLMSIGDRAATSMTWVIGVSCALACILVAGMSRHAYARQTALSIFLTTLALGSVPFMVFRPDLITPYITDVLGLPFVPTIGLILGACGIAAFTGMVLKGMKQNRVAYSLMGLGALGAQIVMIYRPQFLNLDSFIIIVVSILAAGSFYALTVRNPIRPDYRPNLAL